MQTKGEHQNEAQIQFLQ